MPSELILPGDVIGGPHPCLFSGCVETIPEGRLVCDDDWQRVPSRLAHDMADAYKAYGDKSPIYHRAVQAVVAWLQNESWRRAALDRQKGR